MPRTGRPPRPARERFSKQVDMTVEGCWNWGGFIDRYGYGQFRPEGGRQSSKVGAHRWAYEHFVGPIPDGLHIDHLCRNRACVNPAHLEPVTPRENAMRGFSPSRLNSEKTHCLNGHPLAGDNLHVYRDGKRACRTCRAARASAYYQSRKAALS